MIHPNTAYKVWISDILNPDNRKSGSIRVGDKDVFRVSLVGSVVMKNVADDRSFASIALDDSSGQILLRCWGSDVELLDNISKGAVAQIVGRVAEYNGLIYLRPEVVKGVSDFENEVLHRAILFQKWGSPIIAKDDWNGKPVMTNGLQKESKVGPRIVEEKIVEDSSDEEVISSPKTSHRRSILSVIEKLDGP